MKDLSWETFPDWKRTGVAFAFSQRRAGDGGYPTAQEVRHAVSRWGWLGEAMALAEQTHGNGVAVVTETDGATHAGVDALVTARVGLPLGIRVADCGLLLLYDPGVPCLGLVHSGRKGTELNIVGTTIEVMRRCLHAEPSRMRAFLAPCIRPPHYEVDFAREIARQAQAEGVEDFTDCGVCTASRLDRYYSYRAERGQTGRMWGVAQLEPMAVG